MAVSASDMLSVGKSTQIGRPRVLDHAKRDVIIALVSVGCTRTYAARYLKISPQTVLNTAARDPEFAKQLEQAAASYKVENLKRVNAASQRNWKASAWVLERVDPQRFANPKSRIARRLAVCEFKEVVLDILSEEVAPSTGLDHLVQRIQQAYRKVSS